MGWMLLLPLLIVLLLRDDSFDSLTSLAHHPHHQKQCEDRAHSLKTELVAQMDVLMMQKLLLLPSLLLLIVLLVRGDSFDSVPSLAHHRVSHQLSQWS